MLRRLGQDSAQCWCSAGARSRTIMCILLVLAFVETVDMVVAVVLHALCYFFVALCLHHLALFVLLAGAQREQHTFTGLLSFMAVTFNAAALDAGNRGGSSVRDLDGSPLRCVNGNVDGTSLAIGAVLGCVEECAVGSMRKRQICDTLY